MRTDFSAEQLADPDTAESEKVLRTCTHCGFCTATCPTYVLLGDELDSPRGRIYLIKEMLAGGDKVTADTVKHIDRCLSCLACMTTCPSGVNYMHLVDHARRWIEQNYRRPWGERALRRLLGTVLSRPSLFRLSLRFAVPAKPLARFLPGRLAPLFALAPASVPAASSTDRPCVFSAKGERRMRIALLPGCAQRVLAPEINEATIRLLTRLGCEVVVVHGGACCGALVHHLGQEAAALGFARANIDAWERERRASGFDAIVINASGCGTTVKDYGFMLREDRAYAEKAARIASLARDVTEVIGTLGLGGSSAGVTASNRRVAYHSACSMQHGQGLHSAPRRSSPRRVSSRSMCRKGISAVVRPEPTTYYSQKSRRCCAIASWPTSPPPDRTSSQPATSAASASSPAVVPSRLSTPSSFSTGPLVVRRQKR